MRHENVHRATRSGAQVGVGVAHTHVVVHDRDQREDFLQVAVREGRVVDGRTERGRERLTLAHAGQALDRELSHAQTAPATRDGSGLSFDLSHAPYHRARGSIPMSNRYDPRPAVKDAEREAILPVLAGRGAGRS